MTYTVEEVAAEIVKWLRRRVESTARDLDNFRLLFDEDRVDALVHATGAIVAAGKHRAYAEAFAFFFKNDLGDALPPVEALRAMLVRARVSLINKARSSTYQETANTGAIAERSTLSAWAEIVENTEAELAGVTL